GLRNTILGIVLIYPVTTIPVALYMLQGYFRGLPAEVEEAGLMDGLNKAIEDKLDRVGGGSVTVVEEPMYAGANGALQLALDMPADYWQQLK
ncbi:MAG: hypothetical protein AAGL98_15270, partial [Planctomycetota bacterium]